MIRSARKRALASTFSAAVVVWAGAACNSPTSVVVPPLEALVASGDSQYGTPGQTLATPLQVVVRAISTGLPRSGTRVIWTVEEGDATLVGVASTITDDTGSASASVRLGATLGEVRIRASVVVEEVERATASFALFTVDVPILEEVQPGTATPGDPITLVGANFSPDPEQNIVLFSGIRGVVDAASSTELTVRVPRCLPSRDVDVSVQLGTVGGPPRTLAVAQGGEVETLEVGDVLDAEGTGGFDCFTLPGEGAASYLVIAQSASEVGAAVHPYRLSGLAATAGSQAVAGRVPAGPGLASVTVSTGPDAEAARRMDRHAPGREQMAWDEFLREREREMTRHGLGSPASAPVRVDPPRLVPAVGERRIFDVFRPDGFDQVTAVARLVGTRAAIFVDEDSPPGGYTDAELQAFSDQFDSVIHPTVTDAYGTVSDLDENQRVIILFTPAVNRLTAAGSAGFVAGFFFGLDLQPEREGSNGGEVFYALVPDPDGVFSDPRPKDALLEITPAVLAHEFQHMVNFNQRVLLRGAEANEAVWLAEALAQWAEELTARRYDEAADPESAELLRNGARDRARRYLERTDTVSLIVSAGNGSLPERGAGFLYMMYLVDRFGADVAGRLTRTTRTGIPNVEAETGTEWAPSLSDWWAALHEDGPGVESGPRVYPSVDLRQYLGVPFPLTPIDTGSGDFGESGTLRSASAQYYIVRPAPGGSTTVRLGGEAGATSAPQAAIRMRIIRIQ